VPEITPIGANGRNRLTNEVKVVKPAKNHAGIYCSVGRNAVTWIGFDQLNLSIPAVTLQFQLADAGISYAAEESITRAVGLWIGYRLDDTGGTIVDRRRPQLAKQTVSDPPAVACVT
jgi:hypothetical protein